MKKIFFMAVICLGLAMPAFAENDISLTSADRIWTAWVEHDGTDTEVFAAFYEDGAWSNKQAVTNNTYNEISPAIAVDSQGAPFIVYSGGDGVSSSIYIVMQDEKGKWAEPAMISDFNAEEDTTPAIMIDRADNIWVTWAAYSGVSDDIVYNVRKGGTWEGQKLISLKNTTPDIYPEIVSLSDDSVCVIWSSFSGASYKLSHRIYNGSSWNTASSVSDNAAVASEILPSALNNAGETLVLWTEGKLVKSKVIDSKTETKTKTNKIVFSGAEDILKGLTSIQMEHSSIAWFNTKDNVSQSVRLKYVVSANTQETMLAGIFNSLPLGEIGVLLCNIFDFSIQEAYAAVDTNTYLAFGDSITYGTFSRDSDGVGGYPAKLQAMLGKTVINAGINGERTSSGLSRLPGTLSSTNAGVMLLMEGTNDVGDGTSAGTIKHNLAAMIDRATAFGTQTLLATILPRRDVYNDRAIELNNHIRALAGEKGVYLVDMYAVFDGQDSYYTDLLHPTDAGYQIMADNWSAAISASGNGSSGGGDSGGGGGGGGCGTIRPTSGQINGNISLLFIVFAVFAFHRFRYRQAS